MRLKPDFVVLISADAEWRSLLPWFPGHTIRRSPYGSWFSHRYLEVPGLNNPIVFMHGGWGKVAAAGSTQYAISRWRPTLVVNLGTCGGFEGEINREMTILVEKTVIYDIYEQMGDPVEHIQYYATEMDTTWVDRLTPLPVVRTLLVSADRDLFCEEINELKSKYKAVAGDWESGAIAWVANKNQTQCLILRGVTDLVSENAGEAYDGKVEYYYEKTAQIMKKLIESLPEWLLMYANYYSTQNRK